jgi:hypothetical protein
VKGGLALLTLLEVESLSPPEQVRAPGSPVAGKPTGALALLSNVASPSISSPNEMSDDDANTIPDTPPSRLARLIDELFRGTIRWLRRGRVKLMENGSFVSTSSDFGISDWAISILSKVKLLIIGM